VQLLYVQMTKFTAVVEYLKDEPILLFFKQFFYFLAIILNILLKNNLAFIIFIAEP